MLSAPCQPTGRTGTRLHTRSIPAKPARLARHRAGLQLARAEPLARCVSNRVNVGRGSNPERRGHRQGAERGPASGGRRRAVAPPATPGAFRDDARQRPACRPPRRASSRASRKPSVAAKRSGSSQGILRTDLVRIRSRAPGRSHPLENARVATCAQHRADDSGTCPVCGPREYATHCAPRRYDLPACPARAVNFRE